MPGNQERTGRYQREGQFRPQQQYDEEGGYRDDWARGYGGSGANDPEGQYERGSFRGARDDPDRGYGRESRYGQWSRGQGDMGRGFGAAGYGRETYGNEYGYNAEGRDWSSDGRRDRDTQEYRPDLFGASRQSGETMYGSSGHYAGQQSGYPRAGFGRGDYETGRSGYNPSSGEYRGQSQFGPYGGGGGQFDQHEYRGQSRFGTPVGSRGSGGGGYDQYGFERGPFEGRGPKGYQRDDSRVKEDLCERLSLHGRVDASDIEVKVMNGEVTLEGSVSDRHQKRAAEDLAEATSGVRDVTNHLKVRDERRGATESGGGQPAARSTNGAANRSGSPTGRSTTS